MSTDHVELDRLALKGRWAGSAARGKLSLFYTDHKPADLKAACEEAVAKKGHDGALVHWSVRYGQTKYDQAIWYEGDQKPGAPIDRIVAFGDSLSDSGNAYNSSEWTFPVHNGWFLGRFSNGPVWTEHLAAIAGVPLTNWALGGAETKKATPVRIDGIGDQVASFRAYAANAVGYDPSRTLFTMLIGANDFMSGTHETDGDSVRRVLQRQREALEKLGKLGAKKILVLNLPDISKTPSFRADGRGNDAILVRDKVRLYNEWLPEVVRDVASTIGADIRIFDMAAKFRELLDNPAAFGITNAAEACLDLAKDSPLNYLAGAHRHARCVDPDTFVFWDNVHPTTYVHKLIAHWAFAAAAEAWDIPRE